MKRYETEFNIGKCTKMALVLREKDQDWLAKQLGVTKQRASVIANSKEASTKTITKLAWAFKIPAADFIRMHK